MATHPCLRVWGSWKFGAQCQYYRASYDLCLHYTKGHCSQGDWCEFSHDDTWGIAPASNSPLSAAGPSGASSRQVVNTTSHTVCVHWSAGRCRNGDSCRFEHPAGAAPVPQVPTPPTLGGGAHRTPCARRANSWPNMSQDPGCAALHLTVAKPWPWSRVKTEAQNGFINLKTGGYQQCMQNPSEN